MLSLRLVTRSRTGVSRLSSAIQTSSTQPGNRSEGRSLGADSVGVSAPGTVSSLSSVSQSQSNPFHQQQQLLSGGSSSSRARSSVEGSSLGSEASLRRSTALLLYRSFSTSGTARSQQAFVEDGYGSSEEDVSSTATDLEHFDLTPRLSDRLRKVGVASLFPVQAETFKTVMDGKDVLCKSRTGSGKTLGFALPIVENFERDALQEQGGWSPKGRPGRIPRAIVLAPTRELAKQVENEFARVAPNLSTLSLYGGTPLGPQFGALRNGVDIVVGTPGRVIDLIQQGALDLSAIQYSVLDEADMMLKMGFQDDVETIFNAMPPREERQNMLWSATMPKWVYKLANKYLNDPVLVDLVGDDDSKIPNTIEHWTIAVEPRGREEALGLVCGTYGKGMRTIVFTQTKAEVDNLTNNPGMKRLGAEALHGGLSQAARERTLGRFRGGQTKVVVATDVAARGLDIPNVEMVVHYRLPTEQEGFVHRSGRTGRAGKQGINVVLVTGREEHEVLSLEREYDFASYRMSPPGADAAVTATFEAVSRSILSVPLSGSKVYEAKAQELLERMRKGLQQKGKPKGMDGVDPEGQVAAAPEYPREVLRTVSSCMSLMGSMGGDGPPPAGSYSILDGKRGVKSVLLTGSMMKSERDVQQIVHAADPKLTQHLGPMRRARGGVIVDLPQGAADALLAAVDAFQTEMAGVELGGENGAGYDGEHEDPDVGLSEEDGRQPSRLALARQRGGGVVRMFADLEVSVPSKVKGPLEYFHGDRMAPQGNGQYGSTMPKFGRRGGGRGGGRGGEEEEATGEEEGVVVVDMGEEEEEEEGGTGEVEEGGMEEEA